MDRITKSYPVTFRQQQSFEALADSEVFAYFADFCVLSVAHEEEFDTADVYVGGTNDRYV